MLVIVVLFVSPLIALILLVFILIYQQVEGSVLQPMVYSRAVQLDPVLYSASPGRCWPSR